MKFVFEAGDKVVKKNGGNFSNGSRWVTVEKVTELNVGYPVAWFVETQTNLGFDSITPFYELEQEVVLKKLQEHRDGLREKSQNLKNRLEVNDEALLQANLAIQLIKELAQ